MRQSFFKLKRRRLVRLRGPEQWPWEAHQSATVASEPHKQQYLDARGRLNHAWRKRHAQGGRNNNNNNNNIIIIFSNNNIFTIAFRSSRSTLRCART